MVDQPSINGTLRDRCTSHRCREEHTAGAVDVSNGFQSIKSGRQIKVSLDEQTGRHETHDVTRLTSTLNMQSIGLCRCGRAVRQKAHPGEQVVWCSLFGEVVTEHLSRAEFLIHLRGICKFLIRFRRQRLRPGSAPSNVANHGLSLVRIVKQPESRLISERQWLFEYQFSVQR